LSLPSTNYFLQFVRSFFSLTANGDEITLIVTNEELERFTMDDLRHCSINEITWQAIHLSAGARGMGTAMVDQVAKVAPHSRHHNCNFSTCIDIVLGPG